MNEKLVVDAYTERLDGLAREYIRQGLTPAEAEDKAVDDVRREIRNGPPIRLFR